jgi:hypothetical protein
MSNVIEMVPAISLTEQQKEEVLACGSRIRTDKVTLRKAAMSIGRDGAYVDSLAEKGSWHLLGCKDQHEFRIKEGLGKSNWYRVVAVASQFLAVDRETYMAMSMENAERLSVESEAVRFDVENLRQAADMTAREFDDYLTTKVAHRDGKPKNERWVEVKWRMRDQQRKVIQTALAAWKEEHGIEDDVFALETLVVEYSERATLAGFILASIPRLTGTVRDATDFEVLKQELTTYVQEMADLFKTCCGEIEEVA